MTDILENQTAMIEQMLYHDMALSSPQPFREQVFPCVKTPCHTEHGSTSGKVNSVNGKDGDVIITANDIQYDDKNSVSQVLDNLLSVTPYVTMSGGGIFENGEVLTNAVITWKTNKNVTAQFLNNGIGQIDASLREYTIEGPIMDDTTYTITVEDGKSSETASVVFNFTTRLYWGVSPNDTLLDEELGGFQSLLTDSRKQCRTFNCSGGRYFYLVIPTELCDGIKFLVNSMIFSDLNIEQREITNQYGLKILYNIYRPNNIQTGSSISVQVV